MNKLIYKAATGIATASLLASSFVGLASADVDVTVSGNGYDSTNTTAVTVANTTIVTQNNTANITNNVNVDADTGKNDANYNTGGDVSITTGNASSDVNVSNQANANVADVSGCCPGDVSVEISDNGAKSDNDATVGVTTITNVTQNNYAKVRNDIDVDADTGKNDANGNTGGSVSISTGNATGNVGVTNAVNQNAVSVNNGTSGGGSLSVVISGNGAHSDNTAVVAAWSIKTIEQDNYANILNDVDVDLDTGKNDANHNTGGDVDITTGNAKGDVDVSNLANFNWADVDSCGCILDATVKIADNGAKSDNDATVVLASLTTIGQSNTFRCGQGWGWWSWFHEQPCNDVDVDVDTGKNDANGNTQSDGDPEILTGNAEADVTVGTEANMNVIGGGVPDFPELPDLPDLGGSSVSLLLFLLAMFS